MTDNATSVIERGDLPSVDLGVDILLGLVRAAEPSATVADTRAAAVRLLRTLARPSGDIRGRRRAAERDRELDRVFLMLAEAWIAYEHYGVGRTRPEAADLMALTPRQLRTRERLLTRAVKHLGLDWEVSPPFHGRPPFWHYS